MKKQLVLAFAFGVAATVSLTTAVHALTVQIDGTTIPTDQGDPLTVTLSNIDGSAKSQGCFTVEAFDKTLSSPNNRARVRALDSSQDTLILDNAWIKATSANCFKEIYAWHTFSQPPTTSGTNGIRFKRLVDAKALKSSGAAEIIVDRSEFVFEETSQVLDRFRQLIKRQDTGEKVKARNSPIRAT